MWNDNSQNSSLHKRHLPETGSKLIPEIWNALLGSTSPTTNFSMFAKSPVLFLIYCIIMSPRFIWSMPNNWSFVKERNVLTIKQLLHVWQSFRCFNRTSHLCSPCYEQRHSPLVLETETKLKEFAQDYSVSGITCWNSAHSPKLLVFASHTATFHCPAIYHCCGIIVCKVKNTLKHRKSAFHNYREKSQVVASVDSWPGLLKSQLYHVLAVWYWASH